MPENPGYEVVVLPTSIIMQTVLFLPHNSILQCEKCKVLEHVTSPVYAVDTECLSE
jgi:hypothetical protein